MEINVDENTLRKFRERLESMSREEYLDVLRGYANNSIGEKLSHDSYDEEIVELTATADTTVNFDFFNVCIDENMVEIDAGELSANDENYKLAA